MQIQNKLIDPYKGVLVSVSDFHIEPCDIFFTHGDGIFSRLIRIGEKHPGDWVSVVNHTGLAVERGSLTSANIIEALSKVRKHTLWEGYHGQTDKVTIYRPTDLTDIEKNIIANKALDYEGRTYGYSKIATNSLDFFIGGLYLFRRLTHDDDYPICSWVVAHAYFWVSSGESHS